MLSYLHAFHAGNHADILKHFTVSFVIESLNKKEKPYTFFDTHSASGLYDLLDDRSLKTGEALKGIGVLLKNEETVPPELKNYFQLVKNFTDKKLYPGSPLIEQQLLRPQDFLVLSELHKTEYENLRKNLSPSNELLKKDSCKINIHNRNGFEMLKSLTPPATKRGAVLIDPSYEETAEYGYVSECVASVLKKWSNGIIMVWYPLLEHRKNEIYGMLEKMEQSARQINSNINISRLELQVFSKEMHREVSLEEFLQEKDNLPRLYGSGMFIINAPWHLEESGKAVVSYLEKLLEVQS